MTGTAQDLKRVTHPRWYWWTSLVLAVLGLVDSIYLTWIKVTGSTASCSGIGDCASVNSSRYAVIGGIPIALLGALAYVAILVLLVVEARSARWASAARLGLFGVALIGTLYSAYLTYLEVAVLRAICPFCVVSAIAITLILILTAVRLGWSDEEA